MTDTPAVQQDDILLVTVRIEVPVIFPYDPKSKVTWDALGETAISAICDLLPPSFTREAVAEMTALRGPGSSGHYNDAYGHVTERLAEPHLRASLPPEPVTA